MEEVYKDAFKEVDIILNNLSEDIRNKIPEKTRFVISNFKNNNYNFNLEDEKAFKRETIAILSYLYREYLCSNEKKEFLREKDKEILNKLEKINDEIRESHDIEKIFEDRQNKLNKKEMVELDIIEKEKISIFDKLKKYLTKIFRRN